MDSLEKHEKLFSKKKKKKGKEKEKVKRWTSAADVVSKWIPRLTYILNPHGCMR